MRNKLKLKLNILRRRNKSKIVLVKNVIQIFFVKHKLVHIQNEKFKCHQCKFSSSQKETIDFHMKNHLKYKKIYTSSEVILLLFIFIHLNLYLFKKKDSDGEDDLKLVPDKSTALRKCYVNLLDIST